ncbi:MAG TPA: hypothetical protein VK074_01490, partial [Fodinibius sp.]|nr:hypothetical protein [Fodinibius sp.]
MTEKYHMINWVDGMKIRKRHFVDQQHAFNQRVMGGISTHLSAINYGLLSPSFQDSTPAFKLDIEIENTHTVHVKIFSCKAATPGGFIIDIGNGEGNPRHYSVNVPEAVNPTEKEQRHMIVLSANPFKGEETGEPDPEEIPPRRPYVQPTYQLGLLLKKPAGGGGVNNYGSYNVTIGEVIVDSSRIRLNENYIPPCMAVCSSPVLMDICSRWHGSLQKLERLCMRINRKIVSRQQEYMLAEMIHQISRDIRSYLG